MVKRRKGAARAMDLITPKDPAKVLEEVSQLAQIMGADSRFGLVEESMADTVRLFRGEYPGFRESNTKYHDLVHTCAVFLAVGRLSHGAWIEGHAITSRGLVLALCGALFHDSGLIQTEDDQDGTGAKYTIGHEARSIAFMERYFAERGMPREDIDDCTHIICSTILSKPMKEIPFRNPEIELMGKLLGASDLLAQMADRSYLEKLFLLYREFEEAGIEGFDSELMLLEKTEGFYEHVFKKRLAQDLDNVHRFMLPHFRDRWNMDYDPYLDSIERSIEYLNVVLKEYKASVHAQLRRDDILNDLGKSE